MEAVRQSCRPKHQVLILKCYPKFQKTAVDVKPNSSELNYLLYYASTRRSKLQKVGAFLEKRTATDVWKGRIGNVQVTLQILKALMEKSPRDLPLFARSVLKILDTVLRSNDLTLVENSLPTFETLCAHQNETLLSVDQDYLAHYEGIVRGYADFATDPPVQSKGPRSTPVGMRWRSVGLQAIKSIASAESLGSDVGRQLGVILPVILKNLYSDQEDHLLVLQQRAQFVDQADSDRALRPRLSITTVRTADTSEANAAAIAKTTADADKLEEEDIGVLALRSLKRIFEVNNRSQIRTSTGVVLDFITTHVPYNNMLGVDSASDNTGVWATTLIEMIARWAPVQDRYIIMVTAMEALVKSPLTEDNLKEQLILATLISWLLSSNVNLIGLSVMDVLLGLVQQILLLLQLGGNGLNMHVRNESQDFRADQAAKDATGTPSPSSTSLNAATTEIVMAPSPPRKELIKRLRVCIGDLATHIYYSDQISDMVAAILLRLKPSPVSGVNTVVSAIENPTAAASAVADSANIRENPNTDAYFSFGTARLEALKAIKEVLRVANNRSISGVAAVGRNRVGVHVWDGTQWLLRDDEPRVRKAYVDALLTWLRLEIGREGLRAIEDKPPAPRSSVRPGEDLSGASVARRAVSNSKERGSKSKRSHFLQLLHLAAYENALQFVDSEEDILLLHLLLTNLVEKLGINAASSGMPMIFRLQEDIQILEKSAQKVRIGSLVHGYFWALSEKFNFENSIIGREIQAEILRRKEKGMRMERIRLPPIPIDQIAAPGPSVSGKLDLEKIESESLKPFDNRAAIVDRIALAYSASLSSPPSSPPGSPSRVFSIPIFSPTSVPAPAPANPMPAEIKEQMLSEWSKEAIIASTERDGSKSDSLNGSKTGTNPSGVRNFLVVNGLASNGGGTGSHTPLNSHSHHSHHHQAPSAYGLVGGTGLGALQRFRQVSAQDSSPDARSSSSHSSTVRADELKRVLSGIAVRPPSSARGQEYANPDTSSESEMSGDFSTSEYSDAAGAGDNATPQNTGTTNLSQTEQRPSSSSNSIGAKSREKADKIIPPVPPLPSSLSVPGGYPSEGTPLAGSTTSIDRNEFPALEPQRSRSTKRTKSRGGRSTSRGKSSSGAQGRTNWGGMGSGGQVVDLSSLLKGIEASHNESRITGKGFSRPPY